MKFACNCLLLQVIHVNRGHLGLLQVIALQIATGHSNLYCILENERLLQEVFIEAKVAYLYGTNYVNSCKPNLFKLILFRYEI